MCTAIVSRIFVWILGAFTSNVLETYDTSATLSSAKESSIVEKLGIRSFSNWDGVHFTHIALYGYEYEHAHAFFPLLPVTVGFLGKILTASGVVSERDGIAVAAFLVSNVAFVGAAHLLDRLGQRVFGDSKQSQRLARVAAVIFAINPAGAFMSAFYTESVFAMLSFWGMLRAEEGNMWRAALAFSLASAIRSNGALLSLLYVVLPTATSDFRKTSSFFVAVKSRVSVVAISIFSAFAPYVLFQAYAGSVYCVDDVSSRPWCDTSTYALPVRLVSESLGVPLGMYGWIQSEYWGNGLFAYWTWQQLPNFLLASPIVFLSIRGIRSWLLETRRTTYRRTPVCFVVHWSLLLFVAVFTMNVQVTTRFLSACPALYWYAASVCLNPTPAGSALFGVCPRKALLCYFLGYAMVGTVLFTRFYPWT